MHLELKYSEEIDYLILNIRKAHEKNDLEALGDLAEYARAHGVFYRDFEEKLAELFGLLLNISLDLLRSPLIFKSEKIWWFIDKCYDIHFHQIRLAEYPPETAKLFFTLTKAVLQPEFHKLDESDSEQYIYWYSTCVYFIIMVDHWFSTRRDEFLELYALLQPWVRNGKNGHLIEYWMESYNEFNPGSEQQSSV
ncbi:hypothetical protein SAMN05428949_1228 [Chitinophaga sp. YR627]|uniref:hypothetical protein n=1 Tax=Chitinophaga sp. YR627 TaxID=1881041 RepID=UPI0008EE941C|nr:hypothetical protein [Chitinophaga sp. YR627]SFM90173.1 hypothetical protein SAMN05428949_1228 [Chitinophaga sp. YR627]